MTGLGLNTWPEDEARLDAKHYFSVMESDGITFAQLYIVQQMKHWKQHFDADEMSRYQAVLRHRNVDWRI